MPSETKETEDRTHLLKNYIVEYRLFDSNSNDLYQCWAEDTVHAINQVLNAYPGEVDYIETVAINA